jgi:hypothetical protein
MSKTDIQFLIFSSPQKALHRCTQTTCPMADAVARCILKKGEKIRTGRARRLVDS